ncbi:hypothetical protein [Maridesulfovibrio zosterae]|uniref:hypothetical protein n=1 Tax=Maridesulfovibrio zosterae TaxID=82171 RepID=UPI0004192820|nr:hypothetical protein [Maridesulfovibrio zosterae]
MLESNILPEVIEKVPLCFLAMTQSDDFKALVPLSVSVSSDVFCFKGIDVIQERGKLPLLKIDFSIDDITVNIFYFGHISPVKIQSYELCGPDHQKFIHSFSSSTGKVVRPLILDVQNQFMEGIDLKIVLSSLHLWRSCIGLSKVCPADLKKYFSKMQSVSRFQWILAGFTDDYDVVSEKWIANVYTVGGDNKELSVFFENGQINNVELSS